jgi:single-strand DNA-binding protein
MPSLNRCMFIGNLGRDPEMKFTANGAAVCNFSIACNEKWTDKSGERQEKTEWINVVAWNKTAEVCSQYLTKGSSVYVEGKLQTRSWDKDGVTQYKTEVVALHVEFLSTRTTPPAAQDNPSYPDQPALAQPVAAGTDPDDLPFE